MVLFTGSSLNEDLVWYVMHGSVRSGQSLCAIGGQLDCVAYRSLCGMDDRCQLTVAEALPYAYINNAMLNAPTPPHGIARSDGAPQ